MTDKLKNIAEKFNFKGEIENILPMGEGFINDTFILSTKSNDHPQYILQRKNTNIFKDVPSMMDNIVRVTSHLKEKVVAMQCDPSREVMTVIFTKENVLTYYINDEKEYWTMTEFISNSTSFDKTTDVELIFEGGAAIGNFQYLLSDFTESLNDILPGFHNMRFRFEQWDECIKNDLAGRVKDHAEEISWVNSRRVEMMAFWSLIENGEIPTRVSHNDTKINNVLFDKTTQKALCMIDLDTVLSSNVLNDFGDAVRTYTNTGAEDDTDLSKVTMSIESFEALCKGYLSTASLFLSQTEKNNIAFSGRFIVFEQVLRFMMDYINGDTYYKIKFADHNLVRTKAQYALLQSIEAQYDKMIEIVNNNK